MHTTVNGLLIQLEVKHARPKQPIQFATISRGSFLVQNGECLGDAPCV